jgi:sigma-B regulation protein RsbU (phosphoserine phosphatase)
MLEPKEFYRKLDALFSKINIVKSGANFLFTIVEEIEIAFGKDLHIGKGFIYEKNGDEFILISPLSYSDDIVIEQELTADSNIVQAIINSKTYIFDNPIFGFTITDIGKKEYRIPAAIIVHNNEQKWIILFEIKSGWIREEIEFCLNATRAILNYRLLSESIKFEFEQAFLIQKSLLPTSCPQIPGYQIAGNSQQAELVGGDIFDFYKFNEDEFAFCIGDASGHGIPAALMARDVIIGLRMGLENQTKMIHTLKKLNRVIFDSAYSAMFISLFYAEMETNGTLFYVNAGHPPPIFVNRNKAIELESTGLVFGALQEIDLRRSFIEFLPDSVLVLITDGILERDNSLGEEFGLERLIQLVTDNLDKDAGEILKVIFKTTNEFGNNSKWKDDATVVVIKRTL